MVDILSCLLVHEVRINIDCLSVGSLLLGWLSMHLSTTHKRILSSVLLKSILKSDASYSLSTVDCRMTSLALIEKEFCCLGRINLHLVTIDNFAYTIMF